MSKTITVYYRDGEQKEVNVVDELYELPWNKYQKLERTVKMNASLNRDGEIQSLDLDSEDMGDFLVNLQHTMAEMVLEEAGVDIDDVTTRTVKTVVETYGDDMGELGLKLKKNQEK